MLRTLTGNTIRRFMEGLDKESVFTNGAFSKKPAVCVLDGSTSRYKGHEGQTVHIEVTQLYVTLTGGGNVIKLPHYNHETLVSMIEDAAEILFFEYGMTIE